MLTSNAAHREQSSTLSKSTRIEGSPAQQSRTLKMVKWATKYRLRHASLVSGPDFLFLTFADILFQTLDGKASHLTSLFQPFSAPSPATSPPPAAAASSSPAIVGGASSSSSTITSPPAPASSSATTGAPPSSGIKTRFKEYTREHAEAPSAADDKADSPIDDDDRASVSDAHMDSKSIRSIESSMSLSIGQILATKSGDTIRGKKNWTGSLRLYVSLSLSFFFFFFLLSVCVCACACVCSNSIH